ncbi:MAG: hypothetical protein SVY15_09145 [Halobacteriota archaeon]|nr:hypothetical protein [Halobacteriota archaeon]
MGYDIVHCIKYWLGFFEVLYGVLINSDETSLHLYRVFEEDKSTSLYIYKEPYPNKIYFARPAYHLIRIEKDKMSELNETIGNYLEYVDHEDEEYLNFKIPSGALKRDDEFILLKNPYVRENMDFVHETYVSVRIEEKLVKNLGDIPVEYVNYEDDGYIHFSIPRELGSSDFLTYASPCEIVLEEPIPLSVEGPYRLVDLCYNKSSSTLLYAPKCEGDTFKHGVVGPTAGRNPGSYHPATMTEKIVIGDEGDFLQDG